MVIFLLIISISYSVFGFASDIAPDISNFRSDPVGFYPIWESTGRVLDHRELYLGTNGAAFGVGSNMQFGAQPVSFVYRVPNLQAKFSLYNTERWSLATQIGVMHLMEQASRAYFSPMYTSRLDNPDFSVTLLPVSGAVTFRPSDWIEINQSLTALTLFGHGRLKNETTLGYTVTAEFIAKNRHSVILHLGEVGLWQKHEFNLLGTSYRYQNNWFEFKLGYFYRMRPSGIQSSPLVGLGFLMS